MFTIHDIDRDKRGVVFCKTTSRCGGQATGYKIGRLLPVIVPSGKHIYHFLLVQMTAKLSQDHSTAVGLPKPTSNNNNNNNIRNINILWIEMCMYDRAAVMTRGSPAIGAFILFFLLDSQIIFGLPVSSSSVFHH